MTTSASARPVAATSASPWLAAAYAAIFTALLAGLMAWLFAANTWLWLVAFLFIGVGPVLGWQLASGRLFGDFRSIIGGILGSIPLLGLLLYPALVGGLTRGQSIGKLYLWHLIGLVLGVAVFLILGTVAGQDPIWFAPGLSVSIGFWGGAMGAAMTSTPAKG